MLEIKHGREDEMVTAEKDRQEHQDSSQQFSAQQDDDWLEQRTRFTVCMSMEDKVKLKTLAARSDKSVAKLFHEWLSEIDI